MLWGGTTGVSRGNQKSWLLSSAERYDEGVSLVRRQTVGIQIKKPSLKNTPEKYHLGGALSIERSSYHSGFYRFSHVLQLGYWKHNDREQVAYVALKPKLAFYLGNLIDLHFVPGLGYARSFPIGESYRQENGAFAARQDLGKGHFMPSLGVGVGLHLKAITGAPVSVFVRHESAVLFPYPSTLTHLGVTIGFGNQ